MKTTFNSQAKVIIFLLETLDLDLSLSGLWEQSLALGNEISIVKTKQGLTDFYIMVPENIKSSFDILMLGRKAR